MNFRNPQNNNAMRSKVLILILFMLATKTTFGQIYIGIKGAYTMSDVRLTPKIKTKMLFGAGYDYGIIFKHFDTKYVGLQAELHATNRGYRTLLDDSLKVEYKRINTYIEFPSFMQFRVNFGSVFLHINIGPYFSYLIQAQEGDNHTGTLALKEYKLNTLRDNRFDYGIAAGVGLSYDFKWGTIQAEGRYSYGLGDLFDVNYANNPSQSPAMFQSVIVSYCYRFGGSAPNN